MSKLFLSFIVRALLRQFLADPVSVHTVLARIIGTSYADALFVILHGMDFSLSYSDPDDKFGVLLGKKSPSTGDSPVPLGGTDHA